MDLYKVMCKFAGLGALTLNETQPANKLFVHTAVTLVQELYVLLCTGYVHMHAERLMELGQSTTKSCPSN